MRTATGFGSPMTERALLRPLPALMSQAFELVKTVTVAKDCTIRFEGRSYTVPFVHVGTMVEARGCCDHLQIVDPASGTLLRTYPRGTSQRVLIDPTCYDGPGTDRVLPPQPLGAMARKLESIAAILDRLLHASHVLNIKGRSYRLRDLEASLHARD